MTYKVIQVVPVTTSSNPPQYLLDVQDGGAAIAVNAHSKGTTIIWVLTTDAGEGSFNPITDDDTSGFRWLNPPAPSCFSAATSGAVVALPDNHKDKETKTDALSYQLNATINGVQYSTTTSTLTATTSDPQIKNN